MDQEGAGTKASTRSSVTVDPERAARASVTADTENKAARSSFSEEKLHARSSFSESRTSFGRPSQLCLVPHVSGISTRSYSIKGSPFPPIAEEANDDLEEGLSSNHSSLPRMFSEPTAPDSNPNEGPFFFEGQENEEDKHVPQLVIHNQGNSDEDISEGDGSESNTSAILIKKKKRRESRYSYTTQQRRSTKTPLDNSESLLDMIAHKVRTTLMSLPGDDNGHYNMTEEEEIPKLVKRDTWQFSRDENGNTNNEDENTLLLGKHGIIMGECSSAKMKQSRATVQVGNEPLIYREDEKPATFAEKAFFGVVMCSSVCAGIIITFTALVWTLAVVFDMSGAPVFAGVKQFFGQNDAGGNNTLENEVDVGKLVVERQSIIDDLPQRRAGRSEDRGGSGMFEMSNYFAEKTNHVDINAVPSMDGFDEDEEVD